MSPADRDVLNFIMDVEGNGFNPDNPDHVRNLEAMIASGMVWKLQGFWGRLARDYLATKEQTDVSDRS